MPFLRCASSLFLTLRCCWIATTTQSCLRSHLLDEFLTSSTSLYAATTFYHHKNYVLEAVSQCVTISWGIHSRKLLSERKEFLVDCRCFLKCRNAFSVISPLRNDKLVECFRGQNVKVLSVEHFTAAFLLRMECWLVGLAFKLRSFSYSLWLFLSACRRKPFRHQKFFVGSFWKQLSIEPHALLTNLWRAVS